MKKILILFTCLIFLVSCGNKNDRAAENNANPKEPTMSNMSSKESLGEVTETLKKYLKEEDVDQFASLVEDYNETIENTSLNGEFKPEINPEYDFEKIDKLWTSKKGEFIGTNCRINTFVLLKNSIGSKNIPYDNEDLAFDMSALDNSKILNDSEKENFYSIFSKIKTEKTKDYKVHGKKMEEHLSNFNLNFNDNISMVSVVIHDDLDYDSLFIGHVGVLAKENDHYLWIEKISFQEPYQAIKFATKEDCFKYLYDKYKDYKSETTSHPFIMENDKLVELDEYKN